MPKFDFNNSKYMQFWESRDAQSALTLFLNTPGLLEQNYQFWKTQFLTDSYLQPRDSSGVASYSGILKKHNEVNMLNMRAPLGDTTPREKGGLEGYSGSIPDFIADGFVETAMEREYKIKMYEDYFGNDAAILSSFADDVQSMIDEGNQTMSNMAAQLISKGNIVYNYGKGINSPVASCPIPVENFMNAGAKAWADPECKLIDQMREIEENFRREHFLENVALKWKMPRAVFFNVFLKNAQVLEYIKTWCTVNERVYVDGMAPTMELYQAVFTNNEFFSPIEIIEEKQKDGSVGYVRGWKENTVVLCPAGAVGSIKRADLLDKSMWSKYGNNAISKVFAQHDIFTVVNTTLMNGMYREWHTDLMVAAVPVLEEFVDHLIINIAQANA